MIILNEAIWQVLSLLFQGVVAGIIVLFITHKLQERKDRSLLRKHALFLWLEIHGHIAMLEDILEHNAIPKLSSDAVPLFDCRSWKSSQIYMTGLSMKELTLIATYYQSAMSLNTIISCYEGQPLNKTSGFSVNTTLTMARGVFDLLERHWRV